MSPPAPPTYSMQIAFTAGVWTDVSLDVEQGTAALRITHGATDEKSDAQPSTLSAVLTDNGGTYTPLVGLDGRGKQVRVQATSLASGTVYPRFTGTIYSWVLTWDNGVLARITLTASDVLKAAAAQGNLPPFDIAEALLDSPVTYLPLNEASGATAAGNLGSVQGTATVAQASSGGTYAFGSGTGPGADGTSSLVLTPASTVSGYYLQALTSLSGPALTVEAFVNGSVASGTVASLSTTPAGPATAGSGWSLTIDSSKKLRWDSDAGALSVVSGSVVADGTTRHVAATYTMSGTSHVATLFVDGVVVGAGTLANTTTTMTATRLVVGGGGKLNLLNATISHVGVYAAALTAARLKAHRDAGITGFGGEAASLRISRLAAYAGLSSLTAANRTGVGVWDDPTYGLWDSTFIWAASDLSLGTSTSTVYGQSTGGMTAVSAFYDVAHTEGCKIWVRGDGTLAFPGRADRYNKPITWTIDAVAVNPDLTFALDDKDYVSDVVTSTQDGLEQRAYLPGATFHVSDSVQLLTRDAADAAQAGWWRVNTSTTPVPRVRQITIDLATLPTVFHDPVLASDVSTAFMVIDLPAEAPATSVVEFIEGWTETVSVDECALALACSPWEQWRVGVWDSPTYGLWDSTFIWAY